jgi:hypothetical protein
LCQLVNAVELVDNWQGRASTTRLFDIAQIDQQQTAVGSYPYIECARG